MVLLIFGAPKMGNRISGKILIASYLCSMNRPAKADLCIGKMAGYP